jgi:elongation factor G
MTSVVAVEVEPQPGETRAESRVADRRAEPLLAELRDRLRSGLADPYPALGVVVRLLEVSGDAHGDEGVVLDLEALSVASRKAVAAAGPILLEPLMSFEITCPNEVLSGVLADLKSRAADLESVTGGAVSRVRGSVPLAAVLGYATALRSLTRGLGTVSLSPRGHVPVSA